MTLVEMKQKIYKMIEEFDSEETSYTADPDLATKMNDIINQIQNELIRLKKLSTKASYTIASGNPLNLKTLPNFYQLLKIVNVEQEIIGDEVTFNTEESAVTIHYYKYPERIDESNEDTYEFEISDDLLEILPYGVAGDLLKSDISANYGKVYSDRYN